MHVFDFMVLFEGIIGNNRRKLRESGNSIIGKSLGIIRPGLSHNTLYLCPSVDTPGMGGESMPHVQQCSEEENEQSTDLHSYRKVRIAF